MESNFESRSNYGFRDSYGESRPSLSRPLYSSGESRTTSPQSSYSSGESRTSLTNSNFITSESRTNEKQNITSENISVSYPQSLSDGTPLPKERKYNSLDDIDKLIERLKTTVVSVNPEDEHINKILLERKQKIEELSRLVAEARKYEQETERLKQENNELDILISELKKGTTGNGKHI